MNTKSINNKLEKLCLKDNFDFIDNFQIQVWKDGMHLVEDGKVY